MLFCNAEYFISAMNDISSAKTKINECKRLINEELKITDYDGASYSTDESCRESINAIDIDKVESVVEATLKHLATFDEDFATAYGTILQNKLEELSSFDPSVMSLEEYNIQQETYTRQWCYYLLVKLENAEKEGLLDEEMKLQLEQLRIIMQQYDIQDKMSTLATTDELYIQLYERNAECNKELINLRTDLTEEEKAAMIKEYELGVANDIAILELSSSLNAKYEELDGLEAGTESYLNKVNEIYQLQIDYYEDKGASITAEEQKQLDFLKDNIELNDLYIDQIQLSADGGFHPFADKEITDAILNKKVNMIDPETGKSIATADELEYYNMSDFDKALADTGTFLTSAWTNGIGNFGEGIMDFAVSGAGEVGSWFGADTQWAEDFIATDYSSLSYNYHVRTGVLNEHSANSMYRDLGAFTGDFAVRTALTFTAPWVNAIASGAEGMGSTMETSLNSGADWDEAMLRGTVSFVGNAASGYASSSMMSQASTFFKSGALKTFGQNILKNGAQIFTKEGLKTGLKVAGKGLVSTLTDPQDMIEAGCVLADNLIDCGVSGEWDVGQLFKETGSVILFNWGMNTVMLGGQVDFSSAMSPKLSYDSPVADVNAMGDIFQNNMDDILRVSINDSLNGMDSSGRSSAWADYFNQKYGLNADVSHLSGAGIHNTADLDTINYASRVDSITLGQESFKNLDVICQKYGLSPETYLEFTRTPTHQLTSAQRQAAYSVTRECLGDIVNVDGTLKDGVEITKYVGKNTFDVKDAQFYQPGQTASARGCIALASDVGSSGMADAVSQLGLDYHESPFYKNFDPSSGELEDYCYRIIGQSQSPSNGQSSITMRVSSTTDYVPPVNGDVGAANAQWLQNANANVPGLKTDSGCEYITVENPDWGYNSPNNPDTGMGVTKNRTESDSLGAIEFNASQTDLTSNGNYNKFVNGRVERVYLDGRVEVVYFINEKGEFILPPSGGN